MMRRLFTNRAKRNSWLWRSLVIVAGWLFCLWVRPYLLNRILFEAARQHKTTIALMAVRAGADPNFAARRWVFDPCEVPNPPGWISWIRENVWHRPPMNEVLLDGPLWNPRRPVLVTGALHEDADLVCGLLDRGANINITDSNGTTALMAAVRNAHSQADLQLVKQLLARGAAVNAKNHDGSTALMAAVSVNTAMKAHVVELLLKAGARINDQDGRGMSVLLHAVNEDCSTSILALLIAHGADVAVQANGQDLQNLPRLGATVTMIAAASKNLRNLRFLLDHGAPVNNKTNMGTTALMDAVFAGNPDCVRELLQHGADVSAGDMFKDTALAIAYHNDRADIVALLQKAGAKD